MFSRGEKRDRLPTWKDLKRADLMAMRDFRTTLICGVAGYEANRMLISAQQAHALLKKQQFVQKSDLDEVVQAAWAAFDLAVELNSLLSELNAIDSVGVHDNLIKRHCQLDDPEERSRFEDRLEYFSITRVKHVFGGSKTAFQALVKRYAELTGELQQACDTIRDISVSARWMQEQMTGPRITAEVDQSASSADEVMKQRRAALERARQTAGMLASGVAEIAGVEVPEHVLKMDERPELSGLLVEERLSADDSQMTFER